MSAASGGRVNGDVPSVAVVGSGIAGLTAGALLASRDSSLFEGLLEAVGAGGAGGLNNRRLVG